MPGPDKARSKEVRLSVAPLVLVLTRQALALPILIPQNLALLVVLRHPAAEDMGKRRVEVGFFAGGPSVVAVGGAYKESTHSPSSFGNGMMASK